MQSIRLNVKKHRFYRKNSRRTGWLAFYPDGTQLVRATTNLSRSCLANSWAATRLAGGVRRVRDVEVNSSRVLPREERGEDGSGEMEEEVYSFKGKSGRPG